jgi:DNA polymerase-3 subunit alpha
MSGALDELIDIEEELDINRHSELSILEKEKEELGIYVSKHPMEGMVDTVKPLVDMDISDLSELNNGFNVKVGGILTSVKKMITKKGQKMFKLALEDLTGEIEVIIFPREAKNISDTEFNQGDVFVMAGSINRENDDEQAIIKLFYNSHQKIDTDKAINTKSIRLSLPHEPSLDVIKSLYDIIENTNGSTNVYLEYLEDNKRIVFKFKKTTSLKIENNLKEIVRIGS